MLPGSNVKVGRVLLIATLLAVLLVVPIATAQSVGGGIDRATLEVDARSGLELARDVSLDAAPADLGQGHEEELSVDGVADARGAVALPGLDIDPTSLDVMGLGARASAILSGEGGAEDLGPARTAADGKGDPAPTAVQAASAAGAALATAGGVGLLFWLKNALGFAFSRFLVAPLFSRVEKDDLLDNEGRSLLHALVTANPGIGLKELADQSGLGWGTAVYHLGRLEQAGLVVSMKNGQNRHFFKNGHPAARAKKAVAVLKNETAGNMARFLLVTPGATQTTIAQRLGLKAPTVTKYVKRLEGEGLVEVVAAGRAKIVQATPQLADVMNHVDQPAPLLGVTTRPAEPLALTA